MTASLPQRAGAEALGAFLLFATVVGSGIMGERLAGGNNAVALLANTMATGAILFVLITILGPVSGAHMNPAVSLVAAWQGELRWPDLVVYLGAQLGGGILGVCIANVMFGLPVVDISDTSRAGLGQWLSEAVATFGLILTILGTIRHKPHWIAATVALYIVAAYWFTASTSFANPAITLARGLSDSFAGIAPKDAPMFIVSQLVGAGFAVLVSIGLFNIGRPATALRAVSPPSPRTPRS